MVCVRKQNEAENEQIAAALVAGEEATLKRFCRVKDKVTLNAENPKFMPMIFVGGACKDISVVVAYLHQL